MDEQRVRSCTKIVVPTSVSAREQYHAVLAYVLSSAGFFGRRRPRDAAVLLPPGREDVMTHFFFDFLSNNNKHEDTEGTVLPDLASAKIEAATAAGEWMKDNASEEGAELVITVRDGNPIPLFILNASVRIIPTS
jgi:hypothetical protein